MLDSFSTCRSPPGISFYHRYWAQAGRDEATTLSDSLKLRLLEAGEAQPVTLPRAGASV